MKLLTKTHTSQRRLIEILRVIDGLDKPIGARRISDLLSDRGYELGERAVRYNLKILDELGFTKRQGYSGRILTPIGVRELSDALVDDRMGFVNTRIEEYMYRTTFNPQSRSGDVIVNTSIIEKSDYEKAAGILKNVFDAGYTISRKALILDEGMELESTVIPKGFLGIATLCSITIDGIFLKMGIPVNTTFAGVIEIKNKMPSEFTDLIAYAGTSLDPMKIFIARKVTSVAGLVQKGDGKILANVREVPLAAADIAYDLITRLRSADLCGLIKMSGPGEPNLGCPIGSGKIGIALCAGVNAVVAAEEQGIRISTIPISAMLDYSEMRELE